MSSKLDIIIAIEDCHSEKDLRKTIDSALSQNYEDFNVVLAADAPTEFTKKVLEEYKEKNPGKVKLAYNEEKRGRGGAFNLGLRLADSEWISFLNEGDTLSPDFAKTLLSEAKTESNASKAKAGTDSSSPDNSDSDESVNAETDVIASATPGEDKEGDAIIFKEAEGVLEYDKYSLLTVNPGMMETKIYKRSIFDENGLWFPENLAYEKLGIKRLALLCAKKFKYVNKELYIPEEGRGNDTELQDLYDKLDVMSFFLEETYKREFLEEFPEEVEAAVVDDMYINTLFTYFAITPSAKRKTSFVEMLAEAIEDCFPEFETNPYYYEKYDDDTKDLISFSIENPKKFLKHMSKA